MYNKIMAEHVHVDKVTDAKIGSIDQNPILIDELPGDGAASGIFLFRDLEMLVPKYTFDWIAVQFGLDISANFVRDIFKIQDLEKIYQVLPKDI